MTVDIRPATAGELDDAAAVLAAAFDTYAWTRWTIPEDGYQDRLLRLQRLYLGYAHDGAGIVLVDSHVRAAIALLAPHPPAPGDAMRSEVAHLHGERLKRIDAAPIPAPADDAWNLATLGVHPDAQGAGLGGALIRAALDIIGPSTAVALETSDGRNVGLYERAGFTVTTTTQIENGPVVYSMVRPATS